MRRLARDIQGHSLRLFQFCFLSHAGKPESMSLYVPACSNAAAFGLAERRPPQPWSETGPFGRACVGGGEPDLLARVKYSNRNPREGWSDRNQMAPPPALALGPFYLC